MKGHGAGEQDVASWDGREGALGAEVDVRYLDARDAARGAAWLASGWQRGESPQRAWVEDVAL